MAASNLKHLLSPGRIPVRFLVAATRIVALTSFVRVASRARKTSLLLFSVAVLLVAGAAAVCGQSALDGFAPSANDLVYVAVVQPDGKILIGGAFTATPPFPRNRIARLNPDGTLDSAFNPNANGTVRSIALQADGKILVGGDFNGANSIGGQTRNRIARLDPTTGLADSFDPNASNLVESITVQGDGKVLAGGSRRTAGSESLRQHADQRFTTFSNFPRNFVPDLGQYSSKASQRSGQSRAGRAAPTSKRNSTWRTS